jgi:hypothetical protein
MANGFITVNEKDWEKNSPEQRDWLIFNTLQSMNERLKTLEKRPVADKCFALAGGIIGGFAAALGLKWGG